MDTAKLREALRRQGIHVHEGDPVLEMAAICEIAVAGAVMAIEGLNKAAADRISTAAVQQVEAAKQTASSLITDAGKWSADLLRNAATEAGATLLTEMRREAERAEQAGRMAVRAAWAVGGIGAVALAGLAGFWLAGR
jgi:hypothetical protein